MLQNTFVHLAGFNHAQETELWRGGVKDWDDFLETFGRNSIYKKNCVKVASAKHALHLCDGEYFAANLPDRESWRAYPDFKNIAYLDIETTGLSPDSDYVTVAGLYDGKNVKSYIHGKNMCELIPDISQYDVVVTFNGKRFDLPFLKKRYSIRFPPIHIDLLPLMQSLGQFGGLKKIEERFGLKRDSDLCGLCGFDAVRLWRIYDNKGCKESLDRLVRYNAADIKNLQTLLKWAYNKKRLSTGIDEI